MGVGVWSGVGWSGVEWVEGYNGVGDGKRGEGRHDERGEKEKRGRGKDRGKIKMRVRGTKEMWSREYAATRSTRR